MHPSGSWALKARPAPVCPLRRTHGGRGVGRAGLSARLCKPYTDGRVRWLWHFGLSISGEKSEVYQTHEESPHTACYPLGPALGPGHALPGYTHLPRRNTPMALRIFLRLCDSGAGGSFAFVMKKVWRWILQDIQVAFHVSVVRCTDYLQGGVGVQNLENAGD